MGASAQNTRNYIIQKQRLRAPANPLSFHAETANTVESVDASLYMASKYLRHALRAGAQGGRHASALEEIRGYVHVVLEQEGVGRRLRRVEHLAQRPAVVARDLLVVGLAVGAVL